MQKIEKINSFIKKEKIKDIVYSLNGILVNNSNEYPENYYSYEEKDKFSYVFDVCRDKEKVIFKGDRNEGFTFFLVKLLFIDYCIENSLNEEIYNEEKPKIHTEENNIFYNNYMYYTVNSQDLVPEERERLNETVCYIRMFMEALQSEGICENTVKVEKLLEIISK